MRIDEEEKYGDSIYDCPGRGKGNTDEKIDAQ
jgi:hypothetical protein